MIFEVITSTKIPNDTILLVDKYGNEVGRITDIRMNCKRCGVFPCKCNEPIPGEVKYVPNPAEQAGRPRYGSPIFYNLLEQMADTHDKKSHDYASDGNPFANYHFAGMLSKIFNNPDDSGFLGRIGEKIYRLANLENGNKIAKNESIEDTEVDICTIIVLWMASRRQRRTNQFPLGGGLSKEGIDRADVGTAKHERMMHSQALRNIERIDEALNKNKADVPTKIIDYRFHNALVTLLNTHGIDSEMNVADHTIALKIIGDLLVWRNQVS